MCDNIYDLGDMTIHQETFKGDSSSSQIVPENSGQVNKAVFNDITKMNYYAKKRINLYKTEMCRSFEEAGFCKYGDRCQFAHDMNEIRNVDRHPRYKTETCRTFWLEGTCPYGKRCCFIHLERTDISISTKEKGLSQIDMNNDTFFDNDDIIFNKIQENEITDKEYSEVIKKDNQYDDLINTKIDGNDDLKKDHVGININKIIDDEIISNESEEKSDILDFKPFWHTNEALKWASKEQVFCYILKRNHRYHRITNQPKAPGEPVIPDIDEDIVGFVLNHLGL